MRLSARWRRLMDTVCSPQWRRRWLTIVGTAAVLTPVVYVLASWIFGSIIAAVLAVLHSHWTFPLDDGRSYLPTTAQALHAWWVTWPGHPLAAALRLRHPAPGTEEATIAMVALWLGVGCIAGAALLIGMSRMGSKEGPRQAADYGSHGSSRWAAPKEIRRMYRQEGPGLLLGLLEGRQVIDPPGGLLNPHVLVIGPTGSRKTRGFVLPNLLQAAMAGQSIIATDPKGELHDTTAPLLQQLEYEVRVVSLKQMSASDRQNPLAYANTVGEISRLAHLIIANTGGSGDDSPFWAQAEQALLTALLLYTRFQLQEDYRHMASVLELATALARDQEAMDKVFDVLPKGHPALRAYNVFRLATAETRDGILIGLATRLQLWADPAVADLTAVSDFDLRSLGLKKTAVFLITPDHDHTHQLIPAMLWTQTFSLLYELADQSGGRLPQPVTCFLDEFANLGRIPGFAAKLSTMRSRGITSYIIVQTPSQLADRYGEHQAAEIAANCDTTLVLGVNDNATAREVSDKAGATTIQIAHMGRSIGERNSSSSESEHYISRPLITPDEVRRLPRDEALVFQNGRYPLRLEKADITVHPLAPALAAGDHTAYQGTKRNALHVVDVDALARAAEMSTGLVSFEQAKKRKPSIAERLRRK